MGKQIELKCAGKEDCANVVDHLVVGVVLVVDDMDNVKQSESELTSNLACAEHVKDVRRAIQQWDKDLVIFSSQIEASTVKLRERLVMQVAPAEVAHYVFDKGDGTLVATVPAKETKQPVSEPSATSDSDGSATSDSDEELAQLSKAVSDDLSAPEACPDCGRLPGQKHRGDCPTGLKELNDKNFPDDGKVQRIEPEPRQRKTAKKAARSNGKIDVSSAVIREWAKRQGYEVSTHGRVPGEIKGAFFEAILEQQEKAEKTAAK